MPLIEVVAGSYSGTYSNFNSANNDTGVSSAVGNLGITSGDGYLLSWTTHGKRIDKTNDYGKTLIEGIWQGADWRLKFRCLEYPLPGAAGLGNPVDAAWPWGKIDSQNARPGLGDGPLSPAVDVFGQRWTDNAGAVVLTKDNSDDDRLSPDTLTARQAIAGDMNGALNFAVKVRELPVDLILLPYEAPGIVSFGGQHVFVVWFQTT